ncbi:MAG: hypothetical protein WC869_07420 [Phycisphaerae bacterium]|jgi:hypothetical protein
MYHDKPAPSRAYVGICLGLILFVLGTAVWLTAVMAHDEQLTSRAFVAAMAVIWPICLVLCAFIAWLTHAACRVEYTLLDGSVELRCGIFFHETIQKRNIIAVRRVRFIPRVLGWGLMARGCCNRMTNGLLLKTTAGRIFISPSNIERFCAELGIGATE